MEELFRFSVLRAATRTDIHNSIVLQENPPQPPEGDNNNPPAQTFQQRLMSAGATGNWDTLRAAAWTLFPDAASVTGFMAQSNLILGLRQFAEALRTLTPENAAPGNWPIARWPANVQAIAQIFLAAPNGNPQANPTLFRSSFMDQFLALLILRSDGQALLAKEIAAHNFSAQAKYFTDEPTLMAIADALRVMDLLQGGPGLLEPPATVADEEDGDGDDEILELDEERNAEILKLIMEALSKTLIIPPGIFTLFEIPVHAIGFRDLHVVRQHIRGYEAGEIARVENILAGETRKHHQRHLLSNERTSIFQSETTTDTSKELSNTDHVDIKNEVDSVLKQDTKVEAGVHFSYDNKTYKFSADLTTGYFKSETESKKFASNVAKDVTQKASSKVSTKITQSETVKITETFEENENQDFINTNSQNISGIYQWLNKIYLAQVFNYGWHMLFDLMIPDPALSLINMTNAINENKKDPVPPEPLEYEEQLVGGAITKVKLTHRRLNNDPADQNYYGRWVAKYGVTGVEPYPTDIVTSAKPLAVTDIDDDHELTNGDVIQIPEGYRADKASVFVAWQGEDNNGDKAQIDISIGTAPVTFGWDAQFRTANFRGPQNANHSDCIDFVRGIDMSAAAEQRNIAYTVKCTEIYNLTVNFEISSVPTAQTIDKWRLNTFGRIVTAWQSQQTAYLAKVAELESLKAEVGLFGAGNDLRNRQIEKTELKRAAISILSGTKNHVSGHDDLVPFTPVPNFPNPPKVMNPSADSQLSGAWVRWFEHAFEWENVDYVFYPYFWGRADEWLTKMNLTHTDPLFVSFLQAGYARLVLPVRKGFEFAMFFYLLTGRPWLGEEIPFMGDIGRNPLYLDIVDEIKAMTAAPGNETPVGEPWEIQVPTNLIKLKSNDTLPEWHRPAPFPSDEPDNAWKWKPGAPA